MCPSRSGCRAATTASVSGTVPRFCSQCGERGREISFPSHPPYPVPSYTKTKWANLFAFVCAYST